MALQKASTASPNNKNVFSLDDGTREITLVNNYNKVICRIHFRPSDISIMDRYDLLTKDFDKIIEPLQQININPVSLSVNFRRLS